MSLITRPSRMLQVCLEPAFNVGTSGLPKFCHPEGLRKFIEQPVLDTGALFPTLFPPCSFKDLFSDLKLRTVFLLLSGFSL